MNMFKSITNYRNYRRAVAELSNLTNRELDDLGIVRGDIRFHARSGR